MSASRSRVVAAAPCDGDISSMPQGGSWLEVVGSGCRRRGRMGGNVGTIGNEATLISGVGCESTNPRWLMEKPLTKLAMARVERIRKGSLQFNEIVEEQGAHCADGGKLLMRVIWGKKKGKG
ncbi:hypothetical protein PAHAL_9G265200 [Panicum hallii]|uniref:Uncharacterized protein n=2 Tax=Panicum hallii TaxID=206008 RepID=A0A2S3IMM6_9POAL|nr:hypothetical protein PAHAL_9G265200 [Panicum hallii]